MTICVKMLAGSAVVLSLVIAFIPGKVIGLDYSAERLQCTTPGGCRIASNSLNFFVLGDTGGLPPPFYTSVAQSQVATSIAKIMAAESSKFVVNLGDSFYFNGVSDLKDSRFWKSFEDPYKEVNIPWFTVAGNHDHLGNITAEMLHTNRSHLWTFPDVYYTVKYAFGNPPTTMEFVLIDTIVLCGNCIDVGGSDLLSWLFHKKLVPDNPTDPEAADKQWAWIEKQLSESTADYLFVGGHYPIYSICEHGPNICLIRKLDPLLRKYNVTAYFAGHDHDLQMLQHLNETDNTLMTYVVSGAASRTDRSARNMDSVPKNSLLFRYPTGINPFSQLGFSKGGFVNLHLTKQNATFTFYNGKMSNKYTRVLEPRSIVS